MSGADTGLELAPVGEQEQDEDITETEDADTELQTPGVPAPAAEAAEVDTPATGTGYNLKFTGWIRNYFQSMKRRSNTWKRDQVFQMGKMLK